MCGAAKSAYVLNTCGHNGPCDGCVPQPVAASGEGRGLYPVCLRTTKGGALCNRAVGDMTRIHN